MQRLDITPFGDALKASGEVRYTNTVPIKRLSHQLKATVRPGNAVEVYLEAPAGELVADCSLDDVRGREKRFYES